MIKRILTASILIACLVAVFFLREISVLFFDALIFLVLLGAILEISNAYLKTGVKVNLYCVIAYAVLFGIGFYAMSAEGVLFALIVSTLITLVCFTFSKNNNLNDLAATFFTMIYPSLCLYFALEINHLKNGLLLILLVLIVAVFTDTFAYFVGSALKGKKLCPTISPKKTISGAIGGLIGGILGALLAYLLFEVWQVFGASGSTLGFSSSNLIFAYVILGLLGGIFDEIGDLASSQIKRKSGIKDFGNIFPGHGGIMDRIDGVSFVVVIIPMALKLLMAVL